MQIYLKPYIFSDFSDFFLDLLFEIIIDFSSPNVEIVNIKNRVSNTVFFMCVNLYFKAVEND